MAQQEKEIAVQKLVDSWVQAIRDKNMDGILANHTSDILMFDVVPPMQVNGMEAYRKQWELFFQYSPGGDESFQLIDTKIYAGDAVAFCHALIRLFNIEVRLTLGFCKVNGQWLIAHEHHSAPGAI